MAEKLITAPAVEPITLEEARMYLKASLTVEDALVMGWVFASRMYAEQYTERAFVTQTWELSLDAFPCWRWIEIPKGKLQSVTSVTYTDLNGDPQTLATSVYDVDTRRDPGRIVLAENQSWPSTKYQPNAVVIKFVCGYGLAAAVPFSIRTAIQLLVQYFEQRDASPNIMQAAESILSPHRILRA